MNEIFGLSMTYIMIGLLVVLSFAGGAIGWVLARNRIMFMVGVRNIPRRRAQTTLIVLGLMLSTMIISAAFGIGDTTAYSFTNQVYGRLSSVDEALQAETDEEQMAFEASTLLSARVIAQEEAAGIADRVRGVDGIDGAMSVIQGPVAVRNETSGLAEPLVVLMGIDAAHLEGFERDFEKLDGTRVSPGDLGPGEIFINEDAADELDAGEGDALTVFATGEGHPFTVAGIVKSTSLAGAFLGLPQGMVLPLDRAQELFERPGEVDLIAVSNDGGVRDGVNLTGAVLPRLEQELAGTGIAPNDTKRHFVDLAAEISSFMVTFFVVLGLFSIAAGMMLIFLIFVMLAAERKIEMGMMRAVGTKRSHLVQSFMSEGMVYNVGAAAIGCALGVGVSIVMVRILARLFSSEDFGIAFHVTPRSLVVSYSIGVVLTFLTVTFSAWRTGALNIVSAIRDLPDPAPHAERPSFANPLRLIGWIFFKPASFLAGLKNAGLFVLALIGAALGVGAFFAAGAVYGSAAGGVLAVVLGIIGGIAVVACAVAALAFLNNVFQTGPIATIAGVLLMLLGIATERAFPFGAGMTLLAVGLALLVQSLGAPSRPVFSVMGAGTLFFWLLLAGNNVPGTEQMKGDIEMFFLSGVTMVMCGTFVLVYNADLLLGGLTLAGRMAPRLVPAIKTAVAYPLANKFRTGMTIAMISLVMFALVMMTTMQENFDRIFLNDESLGGYDVVAQENPGNPIGELRVALRREGVDDSAIESVAVIRQANPQAVSIAEIDGKDTDDNGDPLEWDSYPVRGLSESFITGNSFTFQARATGFETDEAVWKALLANTEYALVDAFAVQSGGFGDAGFKVSGIDPVDETFEPVQIAIRDAATGNKRNVTVIGVTSVAGSAFLSGLLVTDDLFDAMVDRPDSTLHVVRLRDGADADRAAKDIERALLPQGVQADSLRKLLDDAQAQQQGFLLLIQGFMGIGLFVGIAAVGVVAFRTVVERRQQIGMLRAIGYTRRTVALSFVMESSFTTLLGIFSGVALGLLLGWQLVHTDEFVTGGVETYYIPWTQIGVIGGLAFAASLIMTIIPSRQASGIPIAEALRYE